MTHRGRLPATLPPIHEQHPIHRTALRALQARPPVPPAARCDVPAKPASGLIPGRAARGRPAAAARGRRDRPDPPLHQPVRAEHVDRHELLPARVVHHEVQPEAARAARRAARRSPTCTRSRTTTPRQGMLELLYEMQEFLARDRRAAGGVAPAGRRGPGRADRPVRRRRVLPRQGADAPPKVLVPDSAHGTNPASAALAGFEPSPSRATPRGWSISTT